MSDDDTDMMRVVAVLVFLKLEVVVTLGPVVIAFA